MFAVDAVRRSKARLRAINAARTEAPVPRVLVISNVASFGGGGAVGFRDMVLALREKRPDLDVVAVCPPKGNLAADLNRRGIPTKVAWIPWWSFIQRGRTPHLEALITSLPMWVVLIPGVVQAVAQLVRLRPMLVLTNTMTIPSHAIAAKLLGIPHYWMVREFGKDDHRLWFLLGHHRTIRLIDRLSESIICNSHAVETALHEIAPTMRTSVVHPVVDTPLGTPSERHPGERLRTVLVGYFSQAKGQRLAIEAISVARNSGIDIELTLIGSGGHKGLRQLARRLGVEDLLSIHGPTRDLGPYWAAAHVGLMCSQCEAFGRVSVEAMRAGLPVCGTDSGGTPEIIIHGVNGLLSRAGDANALAANLMTLESDEALRRKLAFSAVETTHRFQRDRHDDELATILGLV
jgi:glycosyltransferase involved in cell wall biosynthesis